MTERRKEGSSLLEVGGWNDTVISSRQREGRMEWTGGGWSDREKEGSSLLEVGGWNDTVISSRQREGRKEAACLEVGGWNAK